MSRRRGRPRVNPTVDEADLISALRRMLCDSRKRPVKIVHLFEEYLKHLELAGEVAQSTVDRHGLLWHQLREHLPDALTRDMSPALVNGLAEVMLAQGYRASTVRSRLSSLRSCWSWASMNGMVDRPWQNPPKARSRARRPKHVKRAFTASELATALEAMPDPYRVPFAVLAATGARSSEVLGLEVGDVVSGELGTWWLCLDETKTGAPRRVPLLRRLVGELDLERPADAPLFPGERRPKMQTRTLTKKLAQVLDAHKIRRKVVTASGRGGSSYDVDCHSTRRAWIEHAARAQVPEHIAKATVGHSVTAGGVTSLYRANATTDDDLQAAVEAVDAWRRERTKPKRDDGEGGKVLKLPGVA